MRIIESGQVYGHPGYEKLRKHEVTYRGEPSLLAFNPTYDQTIVVRSGYQTTACGEAADVVLSPGEGIICVCAGTPYYLSTYHVFSLQETLDLRGCPF